jgi:hypothetical protein
MLFSKNDNNFYNLPHGNYGLNEFFIKKKKLLRSLENPSFLYIIINILDPDVYSIVIKIVNIDDPTKFIFTCYNLLNRRFFNNYLRFFISCKELLSDRVYSFLFDLFAERCCISDLVHLKKNLIAIIKCINS